MVATVEGIEHALGRVQARRIISGLNALPKEKYVEIAAAILRIKPKDVSLEQRHRAKRAAYAFAFRVEESVLFNIMTSDNYDMTTIHPLLKDVTF